MLEEEGGRRRKGERRREGGVRGEKLASKSGKLLGGATFGWSLGHSIDP